MAELLMLCDSLKRPLGQQIVRGETVPAGCYLIVVNILTVCAGGEILITRRAPEKSHSGSWEITGGTVQAGETERQAACRELFEETGIQAAEDALIFCGSGRRGCWIHTYFLHFCDAVLADIRLQPGETADARTVTRAEFLRLVSGSHFHGTDVKMFRQYYAQLFRGIPLRRHGAVRTVREVMLPELLDLCGADGRATGETVIRGESSPAGTYRVIVSIMTVNSRGEILLTRRAPEKTYAGRWEITGGCAQAGETPAEAAVRELYEETGIRITPDALEQRGSRTERTVIFVYYLLRKDIAAEALHLQPGETDAAVWVTPAQFHELRENDQTVTAETDLLIRQYPEAAQQIEE